jgi:hypothetical protein
MEGMSALRFRLTTGSIVAALLIASHLGFPGAEARSSFQHGYVISLGYGHMIGASWPRGFGLGAAFVSVTIGVGFVLYVPALTAWPGLAFVLLALSVWHFTENDVALAQALAAGRPLGSLSRAARAHAIPTLAALAIVAAAIAAAPDPSRLADLFAATTLFHLVGWLVFLIARGTSRRRLLILHAPPLALCAGLFVMPADFAEPLRQWVFSPALYLFWASLHVAHTAHLRWSTLA